MSTVLFALLLSTASGTALEANGDFKAAQGLYSELEFEAAVQKLELASGDPNLSREERAEVLAWLGLCLFQSRRSEIARERFKQAVAFHHEVSLPGFAPPTAKALLDEVRAATPPPAEPAEAPADEAVAPTKEAPAQEASAPVDPPREPAADTAVDPTPSSGLLPATAIGLSALGAAAVVGAVGAVAVAGPSAFIATDPNAFQTDAIVAQNVANGALWTAGVLGAVGLGGLAVGLPLGLFSGAFFPDDDG